MPIKAQLVLPDNLRSTYLRSNFLDSGAVYNTNKPALTSALDANNHNITLKFELLDTVNRESVSLQKIVSLTIQNLVHNLLLKLRTGPAQVVIL